VEISIAGPEDTHGIRTVQYRSWLANTANEGRSFDGANKMRSVSSRHGNSKLKNDVRCSRNNSLPGSVTVVAKVNQKVVGFCTVVRGSEQNSLAEIYIIPAFQGKKIGRRLWDSARQFIDQNNDTTVALLRLNTPAKRFYEGLGFAETGVSWEGENLKNEDGTTVIEMMLRA
jgi:ribosomal protein S18 acetylase RimI-like enzyme